METVSKLFLELSEHPLYKYHYQDSCRQLANYAAGAQRLVKLLKWKVFRVGSNFGFKSAKGGILSS